jgi:hypothetical protein
MALESLIRTSKTFLKKQSRLPIRHRDRGISKSSAVVRVKQRRRKCQGVLCTRKELLPCFSFVKRLGMLIAGQILSRFNKFERSGNTLLQFTLKLLLGRLSYDQERMLTAYFFTRKEIVLQYTPVKAIDHEDAGVTFCHLERDVFCFRWWNFKSSLIGFLLGQPTLF